MSVAGSRLLRALPAVATLTLALCLHAPSTALAAEEDSCASAPNPIACENALPGDPRSDWQVNGIGSETIQGFATSMSVNVGESESFKIKTNASAYHIDILRLGYYKGDGARIVASGIRPTVTLPQQQPACLTHSSTGLIDCGNWGVSASWKVPSNAVSGVYIAHLVREDTGAESQIPFVVRNDAGHSEILLQTSDASWQAYNDWGGNSLYTCTVACPPGEPEGYKAAYAVSYNRPWEGSFEVDGGASYLWYAEYQMIYWLEKQGYNVSYTSENSVAQDGEQLKRHKIFISDGHDEYWSASQREHVESALASGVSLAFFSGNEIFWKTRWAPSTEGGDVPNRTLITYKETHFNSPVDPEDPPTWTGSWADPRFSPPADGGRPANALTGQQFMINAGTADITVPYDYSKLRLWRDTAAEALQPGQSLTLAPGSGTLGYEWDEDVENGFRPSGEFDLSSTTVTGLQAFVDYGTRVVEGATATHHLTMYRAPSGALVFGAGTVQWSWGLANINAWEAESTEPSGNPPDLNLEQATVNLLAEMGAQPGTLAPELRAATRSTDTTPPTSTIESPSPEATLADGAKTAISGSASDSGGVVAGVEVSTDGGRTWHSAQLAGPAQQSVKWSYRWSASGYPKTTIESRAVDDSGNLEQPGGGVSVEVSCPCSIWGAGILPTTIDSGDGSSLELGVKFTASMYGTIDGVRFYKAAGNTGTHVGSLWSAEGRLLAQATFEHESESGWQQVTFAEPVPIEAGVAYVVGYLDPKGHYSTDPYYFYTPPATGGNVLDSPPLTAVHADAGTSNGLYAYASAPTFPTNDFHDTNYWVDPVFSPAEIPGQVTEAHATPVAGAATLTWKAPSTGVVSRYTITPYIGSTPQTSATVTGSPPETSVTISQLTPGTTYTFTVQASNPNGAGPVSEPSNAIVVPATSVPSPPREVSASPATKEAQVSWQAPANEGGTPITGYTITPYVGSEAQTPVSAPAQARSAILTGLANGTACTFTVTATNEIGVSEPSLPSNEVTPQDTIFDFSTPDLVDAGDPSSVELGVKLTTSVQGAATGIRFYKAQGNTGIHVGSLWNAEGTLLATATFTHETQSGWQQVTFSKPVPLQPGATYVAGYFAPSGHYSATSAGFAYSGVKHRPLQALASSTSPDGVYAYSPIATFPAQSFNATNYWVDVMFAPIKTTGPPSPPLEVSATAASGQARVSWGEPNSEGGAPISGYTVTPYAGSEAQAPTQVQGPLTSATIGGLHNGTSYTFTVAASNDLGQSEPSKPSSAVTPANTIFEFATPATIDSGDGNPVELGVKLRSEAAGTITGIRFYKATANVGPHLGSLWSANGALLASATFQNETESGWQQASFSEPVAVKAGATYIAGYFAPDGHYSSTSGAFASGGVSNPPLRALSDEVSADGLYSYTLESALPESSFDASNYWVDVLFQPAPPAPPEAPQDVLATAASGEAQISWQPSGSSGGPIAGYTITPYDGSTALAPISASGSASSAIVKGLSNGTSYTFTVAASNEVGQGEASKPSNAVTPQDTIFGYQTPSIVDAGDGSSIELGVKLSSEVAGTITGIRFYRAAGNAGPHSVSLWSAEGALLATATVAHESQSGWQQAQFAEPVAIQPGAVYVAGYLAPQGHYSATPEAFANGGVDNPPLHALSDEVSPNGIYEYGSLSAFPTSSFDATNYWVDVLFTPAP